MGETSRILLVDNNLADAEAMRQAIIEYWPAAQLRVAWDGPQAMQLLHPCERSSEPLPDLIILDLHLAGVHGRDLLRDLKADLTTRAIPVVVLTSTDDVVERQACLDAGAAGFNTKPRTFRGFSPLMEQFRHLLDTRLSR